ncbi:MAG: NAD-dependent epimerase/dehydratase family protein [Thermoplasmata archaeon]
MKCIVTGAAGFIGSHISEKLIESSHEVIGIDCFTDYYARELKMKNIEKLMSHKAFKLIDKNILDLNLKKLISDADYIFHEAAQPGVRASWGESFDIYLRDNVMATQRILEACKNTKIKKLIYASSSSVYGDCELPMREHLPVRPVSPYGVSKLAAENLCYLYWKNYNIPITALRYFTVYGPRQRPDMAFNRFIRSIIKNEEIVVFGDGKQTRDFTYVSDAVNANMLAMKSKVDWGVFNIGGGSRITLKEVIRIMEDTVGKKAKVRYIEKQKGDVEHTIADVSNAQDILNYKTSTNLADGLKKEYEWILENRRFMGV